MGLREHAEREVELVGLLDEDSDYGGMVGRAVIELAALFGAQGHSGMSASMTLDVFEKVARFKPLSPITSDPDDWVDQSEASGRPMWQNRRDSEAFSHDGGKTWYLLSDLEPTAT